MMKHTNDIAGERGREITAGRPKRKIDSHRFIIPEVTDFGIQHLDREHQELVG